MGESVHSKCVKISPQVKKAVVGIFAHPDDESFGPAGTIYKLSKDYDVYILCATKGEIGIGADGRQPLDEVRAKELRKSAKIIGIKKVYFLGFVDGTLSNSLYPKLAEKIEKHLRRLKPEIIMTFEPRGISGHIDHITVSLATTFVFRKLKFIKQLLYYCIDERTRNRFSDNYFIYFPPGYKTSEINKIVNIEDVWDKKIKAMMVHKSQTRDAKRILEQREGLPKKEYFLVLKNS